MTLSYSPTTKLLDQRAKSSTFETLCVMGLGYIGLPTAVVFAMHGLRVLGVDISPERVEAINRGEAPFVEPDLSACVAEVVEKGVFSASVAPSHADVIVLAVPTPLTSSRAADLSYVRLAAQAIAPILSPGTLVILESTSPPGTTRQLGEWISAVRPDLVDSDQELTVDLVHCPERVLPGRVLTEIVTNSRIVGGLTPRATKRAAEFYSLICRGQILTTDATTAEMTKCVENSFRDVNIAFANELSIICENLGVDVQEMISLANHHPRVNILKPGPGVGGHCIAVDPWFIVAADPENSRLIRTAREVNDSKATWVVDQVAAQVDEVNAAVIAVLGLAFKPDIGDLRESPAVEVTSSLAQRFPTARVLAVEPNIDALPQSLAGLYNVCLVDYGYALEKAEVIVLLVDHREFLVKPTLLEGVRVIDTRGTWR